MDHRVVEQRCSRLVERLHLLQQIGDLLDVPSPNIDVLLESFFFVAVMRDAVEGAFDTPSRNEKFRPVCALPSMKVAMRVESVQKREHHDVEHQTQMFDVFFGDTWTGPRHVELTGIDPPFLRLHGVFDTTFDGANRFQILVQFDFVIIADLVA